MYISAKGMYFNYYIPNSSLCSEYSDSFQFAPALEHWQENCSRSKSIIVSVVQRAVVLPAMWHMFTVWKLQQSTLMNDEALSGVWDSCTFAVDPLLWNFCGPHLIFLNIINTRRQWTPFQTYWHARHCTLRKFRRYNKASLGELVPLEILGKDQQG